MRHQHIRIVREEPNNERKPKQPPPKQVPANPADFGQRLQTSLHQAMAADISAHGYDDRRLLKLNVAAGFRADDLAHIPGIEVLSQENKTVVLAFADARGMDEFEQRLSTLARNGTVTRKEILFALSSFDSWTPADRTGAALSKYAIPEIGPFTVDVELWPLVKPSERLSMMSKLKEWLPTQNIEKLDELDKDSLLMIRVRTTKAGLDELLRHRDVRLIDLPPSFGLETSLLTTDINELPAIDPPPDTAALVAVLDTGVVSGHPLLASAVAEAAGFIPPNRDFVDSNGHGTRVAGVALYGDVRKNIEDGSFVPELRLLSGRVFANDGQDQSRFVEKNVEDAVRSFHGDYGCRVFCLSYGDRNRVYDGRHIRGLAYVLDSLSRELGVLFVVPTGNLQTDELPSNPTSTYPKYLFEASSRLLDPAPALNVLTVGGLALFEADVNAQAHESTIESTPIARANQPSPFTRSGPSVNGAIKPDLVDHAGNLSVSRNGIIERRRLGVLSLNKDYSIGSPFNEHVGTSFAAPQIAHVAARLLNHLPEASGNLLRTLLVTHARWPEATTAQFSTSGKLDTESLLRLCGYGQVRTDALFESLDTAVTLYAEDTLQDNHHHFYELPLPADLWLAGKRNREITVSLAYSPEVRTTRIDYRATELSFRLVSKPDLNTVSEWFKKARQAGADEVAEYGNGRNVTARDRTKGTLQCATWRFPTARSPDSFKLFLVVTRHDANWSAVKSMPEPYAITIAIQDRENVEAKLYQQIQQHLLLREQVRVRVRARSTR